MSHIKVRDIMTANPRMVKPGHSVKQAAEMMKDVDCGVLPVGDPNNVVGMITDRDIVLRVVAAGSDPATTPVQDVMTRKQFSCAEDDDLEDAAELMHKNNVRRLVVVNDDAVVTGIISAECMLRKPQEKVSEKVLHRLVGEKKSHGRHAA